MIMVGYGSVPLSSYGYWTTSSKVHDIQHWIRSLVETFGYGLLSKLVQLDSSIMEDSIGLVGYF